LGRFKGRFFYPAPIREKREIASSENLHEGPNIRKRETRRFHVLGDTREDSKTG